MKMDKKEVLIGKFTRKKVILSYLEQIHNQYNISYDGLFVYNIEGKANEYLVTFKVPYLSKNIKNDIDGSMVLHYKKGCVFSINALNCLVKETNNESIDWEKYANHLILMTDGSLSIKEISKIEDKCLFFK